ncbi:hypothetical protein DF19_34490 [Streptomyces olindensis]|nr:hypothetical protein DF19_34490 [Streptomyces olindensis]
MFTMTPPPARRSDGAVARMPSQAPVRLTSTTRRNDSGLCSSIGPQSMIPAMFARTETGPRSRSVSARARRQSSSLVTSRWVKRARPPSRAARSVPSASRMSAITTAAPSAARARATAVPMPPAPPVTRATCSSRRPIVPP